MVTPVDGPITDLWKRRDAAADELKEASNSVRRDELRRELADLDREVRARMMMWFTAAGFFAAVAAAVYAALTYYR